MATKTKATSGKATKAATPATPHLSPERERALLECYRLVYRAELMAQELDLGCSDDLVLC